MCFSVGILKCDWEVMDMRLSFYSIYLSNGLIALGEMTLEDTDGYGPDSTRGNFVISFGRLTTFRCFSPPLSLLDTVSLLSSIFYFFLYCCLFIPILLSLTKSSLFIKFVSKIFSFDDSLWLKLSRRSFTGLLFRLGKINAECALLCLSEML